MEGRKTYKIELTRDELKKIIFLLEQIPHYDFMSLWADLEGLLDGE